LVIVSDLIGSQRCDLFTITLNKIKKKTNNFMTPNTVACETQKSETSHTEGFKIASTPQVTAGFIHRITALKTKEPASILASGQF